jgi:hypothetical protein
VCLLVQQGTGLNNNRIAKGGLRTDEDYSQIWVGMRDTMLLGRTFVLGFAASAGSRGEWPGTATPLDSRIVDRLGILPRHFFVRPKLVPSNKSLERKEIILTPSEILKDDRVTRHEAQTGSDAGAISALR